MRREMREWVGSRYDSERFDINAVNKALASSPTGTSAGATTRRGWQGSGRCSGESARPRTAGHRGILGRHDAPLTKRTWTARIAKR
jgi:hypothetical protein